MPLNVRNKIVLMLLGGAVIFSCTPEKTADEIALEEKRAADSVARMRQRRQADSLKRTNPLLIVPPDSQYTGDYIDKYPSGVIKFKGFFRFGLRHGQWLCFYPDGSKWSEMSFDNGMRDGQNIAYYPNGKIRYEGWYKKDFQDSLWTYYDTTGTVAERAVYKMGQGVRKLGAEGKK